MTFNLKLTLFLNTYWGAPLVCKVSNLSLLWLVFKRVLKFRSFQFFAPKKSYFTEICILKNCALKIFAMLYFWQNFKSLAGREVFLKNC